MDTCSACKNFSTANDNGFSLCYKHRVTVWCGTTACSCFESKPIYKPDNSKTHNYERNRY